MKEKWMKVLSGVVIFVLLTAIIFPCAFPGETPARASAAHPRRFIDGNHWLPAEQVISLNAKLDEVSIKHDFDVVIAMVYSLKGEDAEVFAADYYENNEYGMGDDKEGIILLIAAEYYEYAVITTEGYGTYAFTDAGRDYMETLFVPYLHNDDYFKAFMAFADAADDFLAKAEEGQPYDTGNIPAGASAARAPRFADEMNLLTASQASALTARLDEVSEKYDFDVVIAVVYSLKGKNARVFTADYYEYNGYGMGDDKAGIILLIATQYRDYAFVTPTGYGTYAFTDAGRDYMEKFFLPHLRNDDYYKAFMAFADAADDFLARAEEKRPYDTGNIPSMTEAQRRSARVWIIVAGLAAGLVVAFAVTGVWTAQLRSVRKQDLAHSYIRPGSMDLRVKKDVFLHKNVKMTARPTDSDSSSGGGGGGSSGSFSSSSGGSYSGSSGKY